MSAEVPDEPNTGSANPLVRPRSPTPVGETVAAPAIKKQKVDTTDEEEAAAASEEPAASSSAMEVDAPAILPGAILPPSSRLFSNPDGQLGLIDDGDGMYHIRESDVGIIEYLSDKEKKVQAIIKQRFTDFMVYEITPENEILHLKDIKMPQEPKAEVPPAQEKVTEDTAAADPESAAASGTATPAEQLKEEATAPAAEPAPAATNAEEMTDDAPAAIEAAKPSAEESAGAGGDAPVESSETDGIDLPAELNFPAHPSWTRETTAGLMQILSNEKIIAMHDLFLQGRTPPPPVRATDSGWGSRKRMTEMTAEEAALSGETLPAAAGPSEEKEEPKITGWEKTQMNRGRGGGRDRGGRGGRGRGRGGFGRDGGMDERSIDTREVLSDPIGDKVKRAEFHATIRKLFSGTFDTFTRDVPDSAGSTIAIKWGRAPPPKRKGRDKQAAPEGALQKKEHVPRPKLPQYIHFTLQKANRDTMDCLSHMSRMLRVPDKALSTAGTKDKRGVTVQRVCLKRGGMRMVDVWKNVNGINSGRKSMRQALNERGERGMRMGDLAYSDEYLELGMLKGNHFTITLRNVQAASPADIDEILTSLKNNGFINYYGMQRFGTASVSSHSIGLALLQSKWSEATRMILQVRPGEHPDSDAARKAWEAGNLDAALNMMPRRNVAERALLEFWKRPKSDRNDHYGALLNIPRNLRLIYVHAYQSYIWNVAASERIKLSPNAPIPGDLVYADEKALEEEDPEAAPESYKGNPKRDWKTSRSVPIKVLDEETVKDHKLADVVLPLPGHDVQYPKGALFDKIVEVMAADGLHPEKMARDQREYSLAGSYRKIIHVPGELTWKHMRYTDPDVPLCQSDEDKILGNEQPPSEEQMQEGEFAALQISLSLGTSAYATMALRELTKADTTARHQTSLTNNSADQQHREGLQQPTTEEEAMAAWAGTDGR